MKHLHLLPIAVALSSLACVVGAAHAAESAPFTPPANMVDHWSQFADQVVTGRVRKIDPWKKHERFAPCVADANVCQLLAQHLMVLTVDVAKTDHGDVVWAVSVPDDQQPKVGQYVQFTLPTTPKELAAGNYDRAGKLIVQPCKWGKADDGKASEGVVCPKWSYSQLKFVTQAPAAAPASAPASPASVPASTPAHP